MSIDHCSKCSARVDTDNDCDFYGLDDDGCLREGMCAACREKAEEQELQNEFAAFLTGPSIETTETKT